ncbi:efflux RND transporter periplasmic adaptor subunit [Peribacillus sp. SCS-155]|uniref:efflux RND transporter periplasmic adaptor subunit n=1 Tax=Peribacillus sedimenti TaxID=3115297 RepID=UPI003905816B
MKKPALAAAAVLASALIIINVYLIYKQDSKVERTVYVSDWQKVKKGSITETMETNGRIMPIEEYPVYFERKDHTFVKFLVKEGDRVSAGSPIFEYLTPDLDFLREELTAEKSQLEGQISGIDEYLSKLETHQASIPDSVQDTGETIGPEEDNDSSVNELIRSDLEQEIYRQELEKSNLEEQISRIDTQLGSMTQNGPIQGVSEASGVIKNINENLEAPIITIASDKYAVEGTFSEKQMKKAREGLKVTISSSDLKKDIDGTIEKVNPYPADKTGTKKVNRYAFQAVTKDPVDKLLIGTNVKLTVTANNVNGNPVVSSKALHKNKGSYVNRLTNGKIERALVNKGLGFQGKQEITSGIKQGQMIVLSPRVISQNHSQFITPVQLQELNKNAIKKIRNRDKLKYFLTGLIES